MSQAGTINILTDNPQVPTTFETDSGNAMPIANKLAIVGDGIITTSGSGKTVTLTLSGTIPVDQGGTGLDGYAIGDILYADTATTLTKLSATTDGFSLTLSGGLPVWAASGATIQVVADTGSAMPAAGIINVVGVAAQGSVTSAGANTVTVTNSDATITQKGVASFATADFGVAAGAVSLNDAVVKSVTTDSGAMTPTSHSFSVLGGEGMNVTHAATVITVTGEDATTENKGIVELATDAEAVPLADTARALTASNISAIFGPQKNSGFQEWTGAGSYYTVTNTDFTLDRPGIGWVNNAQVVWAGAQTVSSLAAGATHYIYIDSAGTIGSMSTRSDALFQDNIVLFQVLVDSAGTANVIVVKENHSIATNPATMNALHHLGMSGYDVAGAPGGTIALHGTLGLQVIGSTDWHDHDLETMIPDSAAAAITIEIFNTNGAGKWVRDVAQNTLLTEYNNAGTPTALAGNQRSIYEILVSKDDIESVNPHYVAVMDDTVYSNLGQAQVAVIARSFSTPTSELAELEMIRMGIVIINATTIDSVTVDKQTIGTGSVSTSGSTASSISVDTSNFDGWLSAVDTTVQAALETLDETAKDGTFHLENTADGTRTLSWDLSTVATGTDRAITMANQAIDLAPNTGTYPAAAGGTQIVTLGTIATGTWEATDVGVAHGGTGASTLTDHGVLVGSGVGAITPLAVGGVGTLLTGVAGADPTWTTATYPATTAQGDLLLSAAANVVSALTKNTTASRYLSNSGADNNAAWAQIDMSNGITGIGTVPNGGTGLSTATAYAVICGGTTATGAFQSIASVGTADQVLTSNGAGALPTFQDAGGGGGGISWSVITGATGGAVDNGYICNHAAARVVVTLPTTAEVGSTLRMAGMGAAGWGLAQNADESCILGILTTTVGVVGKLESSDENDCIELVCIVANTTWLVLSSIGNITVT